MKGIFNKYLKDLGFNKGEIYFLLIFLAIILCIPIITVLYFQKKTLDNSGIIGDTFGGITAPFLSFFGSLLVYSALKSQIKANKIITDQFEEQSSDHLFFRLNDDLQKKIANFSSPYSNSSSNSKGITAFNELMLQYQNYFSPLLLSQLGGKIISHNFEILLHDEIDDICDNMDDSFQLKSMGLFNSIAFKNDLLQCAPHLKLSFIVERYNLLNTFRTDAASPPVRFSADLKINSGFLSKCLAQIGAKHFYSLCFQTRQFTYSRTYKEFKNHNFLFINAYLNNLEFIFQIIYSIKNESKKKMYYDFIYYNLAECEKALFLIIIASGSESKSLTKALSTLAVNYDFSINNKYFFGFITQEIAAIELNDILSYNIEASNHFENKKSDAS